MIFTERLILRGPQAGDLDDMFAIYSDPRAMQYWSTAPHESRAVTQRSLEWRLNDWHSRKTYFQIELDGRLIGNAGNHVDNEVGFILHPDHWRKGIITEAMGAIIPFLWANTDHTELTADADPLNTASVGLLTSLGFTETHRAKGTFCIDGVWSDSVYLALPRPA
jgi:ribosomal-protein-alanine N-acetyltransferase